MLIKKVQFLILTLIAGVKSLSTSKCTVRNKFEVESTAVRKYNHEKENPEHLPSTSTYNKSSCETSKPSDNLW